MASPLADTPVGASAESDVLVGTNFGTALLAKVLAGLFAAGATLALLTLALPGSPRASEVGLLFIVGNAYLIAGVFYWQAGRVPTGVLPLAIAADSTLITAVAYFSAERPSPLIFFYLWVFLYAAYFFTVRGMAAQILYVGAAYGALLVAREPPDGILAWWFVGMGTLSVAAILIRSMRKRVELLVATLYEAARSDPLTNLANRRAFRELLDLELARARRSERDVTVVVGDLDHFKEVNDRAGHQVGDAALQRVARLMEGGKREIDGVARVGGEEFALVLPDTDGSGAFVVAERLRCEIRDEFADQGVAVTMSFGVATYPGQAGTAASLLRAADQALYAAKQTGRNRTVLHSTSLPAAFPSDNESRDIAAERFVAVMLDLAEAVDLRFSGSARHSETVGRYAEMMARELGLPEQRVGRVRLAGLLHDIGKVAVPDSILQGPTELTEDELEVIRKHPELGAQMLEHPSLADVREWVGAHHERPDGLGYPLGLRAEAIPLEAKILAVADAYEAMTSDRSYRPSLGHMEAGAELERRAGTQFDPLVVGALLTLLGREVERAEAALVRA